MFMILVGCIWDKIFRSPRNISFPNWEEDLKKSYGLLRLLVAQECQSVLLCPGDIPLGGHVLRRDSHGNQTVLRALSGKKSL